MRHDNRDLVGTILDRKYKIVAFLGEGGMGTVYKVQHLVLKRECAVKIIRRRHAADPVAIKRFQLEAEAASLLQHPNIIEVFDYGITQDNLPYIIMEYLEGDSLDDLIQQNGYLPHDAALPIFLQVCDAIAHAHDRNVLHRDLKPENIMISQDPDNSLKVKILDFGVAKLLPGTGRSVEKLSITGEICGSPLYMSPEQCMGQSLDLRSDIYSLGCVFYETLCGKLPCTGDSLFQVVMKQVNEMPPSFEQIAPGLSIPVELEQIVTQCLAKERALRFNSVHELRRCLQELLKTGSLPSASEPLTLKLDSGEESRVLLYDGNNVLALSRRPTPVSTRSAVEEALWKEVAMLRDRYGKDCRFLIGPLSDLFKLYKDGGFYQQALEVKHQQMEMIASEYGEESLDSAYCFEELGFLHHSLNSHLMAEYAFKECLRLKIKILGENDPDACKTRMSLASSLIKQDRFSEAEIFAEDALVAVYTSTGNVSLDTANVEILIGNFYYDAESLYKAYDHFEAAAEIIAEILGETHIKLSDCLMDMARCKHFLGDYNAAISLCLQTIAINDANPEFRDICFEHPWQQLSWSFRAVKNYAGAEQACFKCIEIVESLDEPMPERLAQIYDVLIRVYKDSGQMEKAGTWRQKVKELQARSQV